MNKRIVLRFNPEMYKIITKKRIPKSINLKYLIAIPCVNRLERNAINIIERTFESFDKSGMFNSNINFQIVLFESGSKDISYLSFLKNYLNKYPNLKIQISKSPTSLDGYGNTYRMFYYIYKNSNKFDFVIWLDDDIYCCKNFIENMDAWVKSYANYSIFSSLYVPYKSVLIKGQKYCQLADLKTFFGTCCVILKPRLAKYILASFYSHDGFMDWRFRKSILKHFPGINGIIVSFPSLVQHIGIGSSVYRHKRKSGHSARNFIGEENDPKFYEKL